MNSIGIVLTIALVISVCLGILSLALRKRARENIRESRRMLEDLKTMIHERPRHTDGKLERQIEEWEKEIRKLEGYRDGRSVMNAEPRDILVTFRRASKEATEACKAFVKALRESYRAELNERARARREAKKHGA